MKATWDRLEKNWMQFTVEVDADRFGSAVDQAFRKLVRQARIPGFRPGKAPRFIFERHYGKESLVQEALDTLIPEAYTEAVTQAEVEPIDRPEIDLESAEEGQPLVFKGKVQVKPDVKLGSLSGFGLTPPDVTVAQEQVDEQLARLQDRAAQLVPDDSGEVKEGSFTVIDFEGFIGGEPLEGGKGEDYTLEIGSKNFIPGFEEQLTGAKTGEVREVKVSFPEDYHAEHLRGQETSFNVTVKDVKRKELPPLDDSFASTVSRFQSLQELRSDIENRLKETAEEQADKEFRNKVIEAVSDAAEVELPEVLVHRRVHSLIDEFSHSLSHQGMTLENYTQATGKSHEELHQEFEEPARRSVKADLVLEAVTRQADLLVSESEVDAEFDAMAQLYKSQANDLAKLRRNVEYRERVKESLLKQKAVAHLVALNTPAAEK